MADNQRRDDFPTIRLDEEDRKTFKPSKSSGAKTANPASAETTPSNTSSGNGIWVIVVALIALAGVGGCYYLYTLLQQQIATAQNAEQRIVQLEQKLSATGEEIGESTVALQVKVTELSARTEELWQQMDKLWASAWRRNQKEIADLGERVTDVKSSIDASIKSVNDEIVQTDSQMGMLKTQLATVSDELLALNVQLEQATANKQKDAQAIDGLSDKLTVLEKRNNDLSGRLTNMERELREIATRVVSQSPSASIPPASSTQTGQ